MFRVLTRVAGVTTLPRSQLPDRRFDSRLPDRRLQACDRSPSADRLPAVQLQPLRGSHPCSPIAAPPRIAFSQSDLRSCRRLQPPSRSPIAATRSPQIAAFHPVDNRNLIAVLPPLSSMQTSVIWMADPEVDHGLVCTGDDILDIAQSPFFDVGFGDETMLNKYIDRVHHLIAESIEAQLGISHWHRTRHPKAVLHPLYTGLHRLHHTTAARVPSSATLTAESSSPPPVTCAANPKIATHIRLCIGDKQHSGYRGCLSSWYLE